MRTYRNPWIPAEAISILKAEAGTILDVGGGAAPYCRATHIVDIQPFDAERLARNAWGSSGERGARVAGEENCPLMTQIDANGKHRAGGRMPPHGSGTQEDPKRRLGSSEIPDPDPLRGPRDVTGDSDVRIRADSCDSREVFSSPVSSDRRTAGPTTAVWTASDYTQLDLCSGQKWPFGDKQFDLGLCSHCLEDLRDPLPAVRELSRVCKRVLILTPSRLLEQTLGIDHPRYCGFYHHPWMVFQKDGALVFRRKTPIVNFPACHIVCPIGMTLKLEHGAAFFLGEAFEAKERVFWSENEDYEDYRRFIQPFRRRVDLFVNDPVKQGWRPWFWYFRQKYHLGRS